MHIPVHSPWLPGYIDVTQTILLMLTKIGLFLDRYHVEGLSNGINKLELSDNYMTIMTILLSVCAVISKNYHI